MISPGAFENKIIKCKYCGNDFVYDCLHINFCSYECRRASQLEKHKITLNKTWDKRNPERFVCKECKGRIKERATGHEEFCSKECGQKSRIRKRKQLREKQMGCKTIFKKVSVDQ